MAVEPEDTTAVDDPPVDDMSGLDALADDPSLDSIDPTDSDDDTPASSAPEASPESAGRAAPATPAVPSPAPVAAPPAASFRDRLTANGVQLASRDDDGAVNEISTFLARDLPVIQQYAQLGQQVQPHLNEFREFLAQRGQPQPRQSSQPQSAGQQSAQSPPQEEWMPLPEFDPAWNGMVEYDDAGNMLRAKNGAALDLPQRITAYNQAREKRGQEIVNNFPTLVDQRATSVARREAQAVFNEMMAAREQSQFVQDAIGSNEKDFYVLDANGNKQVDLQGRPLMTNEGVSYYREVATLQQLGMTDDKIPPHVQHWLALRLIGKLPGQQQPSAGTAQPAAQPTPAPAAAPTRQQQLIERNRQAAARTAGRGGSATNNRPGQLSPDQNDSLPPDKMLADAFDAVGIGAGTRFGGFDDDE